MLSYKKWKKLNESLLGASLTLGIKSPVSIGNLHTEMGDMRDMGDMGDGDGMGAMLHKFKKKRPPMDDEDLEDDEEFEDDEDLEDDEEFGDEEDLEDDEEFGDEEEEEEEEEFPPAKRKPMMGMKPPFGEAKCPAVEVEDEEEEEEEVEDDDEVEEEDEEEIEFQKKKMGKKAYQNYQKKKMGGNSHGASYQKKNGKKKKMAMGPPPKVSLQKKNQKKNQKKMTKEEVEFLNSLKQQTGATKFALGDYGFWMPVQEDALIAPTDPNAGVVVEPKPGDVGYAPQGRIG